MSAIITSAFRINNAKNLVASVTNDRLYITVGKSDTWPNSDNDVAVPVDSHQASSEFSMNVLAMKHVEGTGAALMIPIVRFALSPFKEWDPTDENNLIAGAVSGVQCLPSYCVVQSGSDYRVYKCIRARKVSGLIAAPNDPTPPSTVSTDSPEDIGGYLWAYMFSATDSGTIFSRDFMPVPASDGNPKNNRGKIFGYKVKNGGLGYTNGTFDVTVMGDGTAAAGTATIAGGTVVSVAVKIVSSAPQYGANYTNARVVLTGAGTPTVPAEIVALLTPLNGHGFDPQQELGAYYAGFGVNLVGDEDPDLPVTNDYRQVGLLLNPTDHAGDVLTSEYVAGQQHLSLTGVTGSIPMDGIIFQPTTGAKAFVDSYGSGNLYFHKNYSSLVNFIPFNGTDPIFVFAPGTTNTPNDGSGRVADASVSGINTAEFKYRSGDLLFMENRKRVTRADSQTEQIRLIIQF